MLRTIDFTKNNGSNGTNGFKCSELGEQLAALTREAKDKNIPILIIVDGWESSGRGFVMNDLARELDNKYTDVEAFENPTDDEKAHTFLWRFWDKIPKRGHVTIFDRSMYFELMDGIDEKPKVIKNHIKDLSYFEKQLVDDGMIVIKFFLHLSQAMQKERMLELVDDKNRCFLINERDWEQNRNYDRYFEHFNLLLEKTNFPHSPWNVVSSQDLKSASKEVLEIAIKTVASEIERLEAKDATKAVRSYVSEERPLDTLMETPTLTREEYDAKKEALQREAADLSYELFTRKIPVVIVFEGMDAAGKGGAIQRLTRYMDPRSYRVHPTSAPDQTENQYHYLHRFYTKLPTKGKTAIFDRSWYGRVMVERVENFASTKEWERAYQEINEMEKDLIRNGILIIKYFLYISNEEQLARFENRIETPNKNHKITDEDWRNREKWDPYLEAMNQMLVRTSTKKAPWNIINGNDKYYARIKVLETYINTIKKGIKVKGKG